MEDAQGKQSRRNIRRALIGLVGAAITACGGLGGAALSAGLTLYRIEREIQVSGVQISWTTNSRTIDKDFHRKDAKNAKLFNLLCIAFHAPSRFKIARLVPACPG